MVAERESISRPDYYPDSNVRTLRTKLREQNLPGWCAKEYRPMNLEVLKGEYVRYPREEEPSPVEETARDPRLSQIKTPHDFNQFFDELHEKIQTTLPPRKLELLNLVESGKSDEEIADALGIAKVSLGRYIWEVRSKIEEEDLTPRGILLISAFKHIHNQPTLLRAAKEGRMTGRKFLRMWYSHEVFAKKLRIQLRGTIPPAIQAAGWVKACDYLTEQERGVLRNNPIYANESIIINRVICTTEDVIASIIAKRVNRMEEGVEAAIAAD